MLLKMSPSEQEKNVDEGLLKSSSAWPVVKRTTANGGERHSRENRPLPQNRQTATSYAAKAGDGRVRQASELEFQQEPAAEIRRDHPTPLCNFPGKTPE